MFWFLSAMFFLPLYKEGNASQENRSVEVGTYVTLTGLIVDHKYFHGPIIAPEWGGWKETLV